MYVDIDFQVHIQTCTHTYTYATRTNLFLLGTGCICCRQIVTEKGVGSQSDTARRFDTTTGQHFEVNGGGDSEN